MSFFLLVNMISLLNLPCCRAGDTVVSVCSCGDTVLLGRWLLPSGDTVLFVRWWLPSVRAGEEPGMVLVVSPPTAPGLLSLDIQRWITSFRLTNNLAAFSCMSSYLEARTCNGLGLNPREIKKRKPNVHSTVLWRTNNYHTKILV